MRHQKIERYRGSSLRSIFWASRHPCRPGFSGLRYARSRVRDGYRPPPIPCANSGRIPSGVKDTLRRAAWHPVFRASQNLACAYRETHHRRPSLTPLPPFSIPFVPDAKKKVFRTGHFHLGSPRENYKANAVAPSLMTPETRQLQRLLLRVVSPPGINQHHGDRASA